MYRGISHLLSRLISGPAPPQQTYFVSTSNSTPEPAYQVDLPQLEIMLEGEFTDNDVAGASTMLWPHDALFVPAGDRGSPQ